MRRSFEARALVAASLIVLAPAALTCGGDEGSDSQPVPPMMEPSPAEQPPAPEPPPVDTGAAPGGAESPAEAPLAGEPEAGGAGKAQRMEDLRARLRALEESAGGSAESPEMREGVEAQLERLDLQLESASALEGEAGASALEEIERELDRIEEEIASQP